MMDDFIGTYGNNLIVAVVGVGVALLLLAIALWIIRRRSGSAPFIRGGRNRQPRLQVLDATAVDARRRLVLVRRDNVEHLVMIGGPTDIVIESGIGAIPIVKEVREPEELPLKSLPRQENETKAQENAIQQERREALPQQSSAPSPAPSIAAAPILQTEEPAKRPLRAEPAAPVARAPAAATPQPPRPAPVARDVPPAPRPAPPVVARDIPRPAPQPAPAATPAAAPAPVSSPVASAPVTAAARPAPDVATPVRPPVAVQAAAALPLAAAVIDTPTQSAEPKQVDAPVVSIAPQPVVTVETEAPHPAALFTAREAVIDQSSAADFLDAARERVLPTLTQPAPSVDRPDAVVVASDAEPKFSDDLASDFESFLEAEIAKGQDAAATASNDATPAPKAPVKAEIVEPPMTGATPDKDMQKEMARIFGELSVTRDR